MLYAGIWPYVCVFIKLQIIKRVTIGGIPLKVAKTKIDPLKIQQLFASKAVIPINFLIVKGGSRLKVLKVSTMFIGPTGGLNFLKQCTR